VTAYSPAIALDGAKTATGLIQAAGGAVKKSATPRGKDEPASKL